MGSRCSSAHAPFCDAVPGRYVPGLAALGTAPAEIEVWRSLVARAVRVGEVGGSNPLASVTQQDRSG